MRGSLLLLGLLGQQDAVDVGDHAARGDRDAGEQLVELFVVANGELDVAGHDPLLLVVAGGVPGELKSLGGEVLEDSGQVDGGAGADAGGVAAVAAVV